jgi:DNA-binding transcriptional LysR family regulator
LRSLDDFRAECKQTSGAFTIGAGDSLIQWLVIPRLGKIIDEFPGTHFATTNLRTNEIVQQLTDCRLDFGIIRKNAMAPGLKSVSLGTVSYVALVPENLARTKKKLSLRQAIAELPLATQTTDGQFTAGLRTIAKTLDVSLSPALACQSFPQTMAALRSGRFWAIVPELAARDLPSGTAHRLTDAAIAQLDREAMLAWNPRLVRVRPNAAKIAVRLQHSLAIT